MFIIYKVSVFIHVISASFWLGGILFTIAVLVPASRHRLLESNRGNLFSIVGRQFSRISWILFAVLITTGIIQLWARGFSFGYLTSNSFWQSEFGSTLAIKLVLFSMVILMSGLHDFWLGPKAITLMNSNYQENKTGIYQKATRWAGRLNLLLGLFILYFATTLVRG